jgi:hypothetical protein
MEAFGIGAGVETTRRSARWDRLRGRLPRILILGTVAILALIGLREVVSPEAPPPPAPAPDINVDQAAEDFAQRFAREYLTIDPLRPDARERALASLVPEGLDTDAGVSAGSSAQTVTWTQVAQNQRAAAGGRVIVVAAHIEEREETVYLAVPVLRRDDGSLQMSSYPSFVGPPVVETEADLPDRAEVEDAAVIAMTRRVVENYLARDERLLAADLARKAVISLPPEEMRLVALEEVVWTSGTAKNSEGVLVTVEARDEADTSWTLTYELGVERDAGRPVVSFVETVPTQT